MLSEFDPSSRALRGQQVKIIIVSSATVPKRAGIADPRLNKGRGLLLGTNKLCAWRHNMPRPSPPPVGA